ncbi:MAG: pirin family protein [Deltaproteobacteria bacterium]|nr:pirin family protein [Deltaproteobacteria bacterium]
MDTGRGVHKIVEAIRTIEGGGFPVRRPFPTVAQPQVDPFILLDHFGPTRWEPGQAMGAPDHPHRGFETVTYILAGRNEHRDSVGNHGVLGPGDVQWMTAGAGVVHAEMPEAGFLRDGGLSHGFQIWVNLPARDKMIPPRYQDIPKAQIPSGRSDDGRVEVRVIAGEALGVSAAIETRTPITLLHFEVAPGGVALQRIPSDHSAFLYVFDGAVRVGSEQIVVGEGQLALLGPGEEVGFDVPAEAADPAQLLLLSGIPLNEPIARWGPFVMNTDAQLQQAIADYQNGRMGQIHR